MRFVLCVVTSRVYAIGIAACSTIDGSLLALRRTARLLLAILCRVCSYTRAEGKDGSWSHGPGLSRQARPTLGNVEFESTTSFAT